MFGVGHTLQMSRPASDWKSNLIPLTTTGTTSNVNNRRLLIDPEVDTWKTRTHQVAMKKRIFGYGESNPELPRERR